MKIKILLLFLLLIPLFSGAQKRVILEGVSPFFKDGDTVLLSQLLPKQAFKDRKKWTTIVSEGMFRFEFEENSTEEYDLKIGKELRNGLFLTPGFTQIKFKDKKGKEIQTNNSVMRLYEQLCNQNHQLIYLEGNYRRLRGYYRQYLNQEKINPEIEVKKRHQVDSAEQAFHEFSMKWSSESIQKNPNSILNTKILYDQLEFMPEDTVRKLYLLIPDSLKQNSFGKRLQFVVNHVYTKSTAPNIIQKDTEGNTVQLSDFRGKYVLIDFWASWCVPCRKISPLLVKIYQKFKHKNFTIFSVSLDSDKKAWAQAIQQDKLDWVHVSDLKSWDCQAQKDYMISSIPANVLIDPMGKIVMRNIDPNQLEAVLSKVLSKQ